MKGVNRAFPYVAADDVNSIIEEHTPVLFRLVISMQPALYTAITRRVVFFNCTYLDLLFVARLVSHCNLCYNNSIDTFSFQIVVEI